MSGATAGVLLGSRGGAFTFSTSYATNSAAGPTVLADLDRDGWLDILTQNIGVNVLWGNTLCVAPPG